MTENEIANKIIGLAIGVHQSLGPGSQRWYKNPEQIFAIFAQNFAHFAVNQ